MSVRVTQGMLHARQLADVARATSQLADATQLATSQKRISKPSDDPTGTARALALRDKLSAVGTQQDAAESAGLMLDTADTALQGISESLARVRELTVRGASATTGEAGRQAIAAELGGIIAGVKDLANAQSPDGYVFAGTAVGTPPYAASSDAYQGNDGTIAQSVGPGVGVRANPVVGSDLFGSGGGDGKLLDVLRSIQAHLTSGDTAALGGADLTALTGAQDATATAAVAVGAGRQRIDAATSRLQEATLATTKGISGLEDADLASSLISLTQQQQAYQAALKATGSLVGTSLMDFL